MASTDSQPAAAKGPLPTYKGSCHCGFITYTCTLNLAEPNPSSGAILTRCNCSICHKSGTLLAAPEELTVLTPAGGEQNLSKYSFGSGQVQHTFCPTCGIRCFLRGEFATPERTVKFVRVNVLTLNEREDGKPMDDLRSVQIMYFDGKSGDWSKPLSKTPYEGGAV